MKRFSLTANQRAALSRMLSYMEPARENLDFPTAHEKVCVEYALTEADGKKIADEYDRICAENND